MNAAVFLDRDNTLIDNDGDMGDPDKVHLIQGAGSAIASLRGLGYKVVVVSNQGGVARGKYTEQDVDAVHERIRDLVRANTTGADIDRFYYCPYHPKGRIKRYKRQHPWRKPQPGMLLQAARDMHLDLGRCWMIGDRAHDVRAGAAAGTRTILLQRPGATYDDDDDAPKPTKVVAPSFVAQNLIEAVRIVAQQRQPETAEEIRTGEPGSKRWTTAAAATIKQKHGSNTGHRANPTATAVQPAKAPARPHQPTRPFHPLNAPVPKPAEDEHVDGRASEAQTKPAPAKPTPASKSPRRPGSKPPADKPRPDESNPSPATTEDHAEPTNPTASPAPIEVTLRQILQELRNQRTSVSEFSYLSVLAIVLQMVALVCLLAALLLGRTEEALFIRWLGAGVLIQLATIAALLFGR
ncbi:MAG: HAD-IIIA family hydrolase [Phycisphaeraceae bacterium]